MGNLRRFTFTNNFQPIVPSNFDITASWDRESVYDTSSFISFMQSKGLSNVIVTDFRLVSNKLTCNMTADGNSLMLNNNITILNKIGIIPNLLTLGLSYNSIEIFNPTVALPSTLYSLDLTGNLITDFNPSIALPKDLSVLGLSYNLIEVFDPILTLPSTLTKLNLAGNLITDFNPSTALPVNLEELSLVANQIVNFNPLIRLPNQLQNLFLNNNKIVNFDPTIRLPNQLKILDLYGNQIISFNPSFDMPYSLETLSLYDNLMTLQGYIDSEPWANDSLVKIINFSYINFSNNVNSIVGTPLQTILQNKNWLVFV